MSRRFPRTLELLPIAVSLVAGYFYQRSVDSPEEALRLFFRGSPTAMVNGDGPWDNPDAPIGFSCCAHRTESEFPGPPSNAQLREAVERAVD